MTDSFEHTWVEVRRFDSRSEAEQHALVLVAIGIECQIAQEDSRFGVRVAPAQAARARRELAAYGRENEDQPEPTLRKLGEGIEGALAYCAILVFTHAAAGRQAFSLDWLSAGHAQAGLIAGGEWWRAVTALGLHADLEHLLANLAFGSLFGIYLSQLLGAGLAWFAIVLAGSLGNVANALMQPTTHGAIGASTAVFGALGLLSGLMWKRQARTWHLRLRQWTPIAAGAMLLVFIGVGGERTDVGAHLAGFLVGCLLGAGLYLAGPHLPLGRRAQWAFGAAAPALFALSWAAAFSATEQAPAPLSSVRAAQDASQWQRPGPQELELATSR